MDTNTHSDTQTHRIHSCKKRKRETTSTVTKVCHGQFNLNWTFSDTNTGIKKNHNPIKTVDTIKTKGNTKINHLLPEVDLKRQKHVLKKNK